MVFTYPKTENGYHFDPELEVFRDSRQWFYLAIISLGLSGILALMIALARTPHIYNWLSDPSLFKKGLVIHVNLGFLIWLSSFLASIFSLLPSYNRKFSFPLLLSFLGVILIAFLGIWVHGKPVLSNYIPMIDHPLFLIGIFLFTTGVFLSFFDWRRLFFTGTHRILSYNSIWWLKTSVILFIVAYEVGILSYLLTPGEFDVNNYYEIIFWAPGHIFVFSIEALKVSLWLAMFSLLFPEDKKLYSHFWIQILAVIFLVFPLLSFFIFRFDTFSSQFRSFFTFLMKWGIFPVILIIIAWIFFRLKKFFIVFNFKYNISRMDSVHKYILGSLLFSIFMTLLGFVLGALIRVPNTMVPGHYHASIGAVTLTLMTFSIVLFDYYQLPIYSLLQKYKIFSYQPLIYAIGQSIFAIGFALAGINGQGRKLYAGEQKIYGFWDYIGLGFMGIGGMIAVFSGVLFIMMFLYCIRFDFKFFNKKYYINIFTNFKNYLLLRR